MKHERTGQVTAPRFPYEVSFEAAEKATRREQLARWITSAGNPYFAKSYVNRLWGYMLGVGLIEPLDDLKETSLDFYAAVRSAYYQNRGVELNRGRPLPTTKADDIFDETFDETFDE